jgi:DNA-binding IclR family transcriptional regulator
MSVGGAQAVRRAVDVLRTVAQLQRSGATLGRVTQATGLSGPTAYRLLRSLVEERLLAFEGATRSYHVGPLAFELGLAAPPEVRVEPRWQDAVLEVARRTRLTSYLIARSHDDAVCLHRVEGTATIRALPMEVGQRVPLGFGAGSLAILAALPDAEVEAVIGGHRARYEVFPGGEEALARLPASIRATRERGFSISAGTVADGVIGLGVLVRGQGAAVPLAITLSAVGTGFDDAEAQHLAATITRAIRTRGGR